MKLTDHQSVRSRGGINVVMYGTHWKGFTCPSWGRQMDLQLSRHQILLYWATVKPTTSTVDRESALPNGNLLEVTASVFRHLATAGCRVLTPCTDAAPRCFPTESLLLAQRRRRFVAAQAKSARVRPSLGNTITGYVMPVLHDPGPIKFPLSPSR